MKILHLNKTFLLAGIAGFLALPVTSQAAVIAVDSATFSPGLSSGELVVDTTHTLSSFTVGTTTYTDLEGATASGATGDADSYVFGTSSANPGYYNDINAAMTGLDFSRGFANPATDVIFQFSQALQNYQGFAGFEGDGNNAFELSLVDASGTAVGDYTLSANN